MPPTPVPGVGDLWLVNFGPPVPGEAAGVHPALIVAPQSPLIRNSAIPVSVVPLTSKQRPRMSHHHRRRGPASEPDDWGLSL